MLIQNPQKGPPLDLINFPDGLLGGRWGSKRTSWDPAWARLEIPQVAIVKKCVLLWLYKIVEAPTYVKSGAFRAPKSRFSALGAPWSPPEAEPFRSRPSRSSPKPTLELPGPLQIPPRAPRSSKEPHQINKVSMLKGLEICVFGLRQKMFSGCFFFVSGPVPRPPPVHYPAIRRASGCPKSCLGLPRDLPGGPRWPGEPPMTFP